MASHLQHRRIVITRPEADARTFADRLRARGADPIMAPAIEIEFTDPVELGDALERIGEFDWIVFTSRNGVRAVYRMIDSIAGPKVAVIGPATAEALAVHGVKHDFIPSAFVAESLLEEIGDVRNTRILLPRADIARVVLADGLRSAGAIVEDIAAYRTRTATPSAVDLESVDAVTFTSSSTVRGFLERSTIPDGAAVVCIGPITAATASELGLEVAAVAAKYTEDGLIDALEELFADG